MTRQAEIWLLDSLYNINHECLPHNNEYGKGLLVGIVSCLMGHFSESKTAFMDAIYEIRRIGTSKKMYHADFNIRKACIPEPWLADFISAGIFVR